MASKSTPTYGIPVVRGVDLAFRPATYWAHLDAGTATMPTPDGEHGRPPLPPLVNGEVEIARVACRHGAPNVYSVRAVRGADGICIEYRVVDQRQSTLTLACESSKAPLTLAQLVHLLDHVTARDHHFLGKGLVMGTFIKGDNRPFVTVTDHHFLGKGLVMGTFIKRPFVTVRSEQYPKLAQYYQRRMRRWADRTKQKGEDSELESFDLSPEARSLHELRMRDSVMELNQQLLLDPAAAVRNPTLATLLNTAPAALHPLARGLALLEMQGAKADALELAAYLRRGLRHCDIVGVTKVRMKDKHGNPSTASETVRHEVTISPGRHQLVVRFASEGTAWYSAFKPNILFRVALDRFLTSPEEAFASPTALHAAWDACAEARPDAFPEDSGAQIGMVTFKLVAISDVPLTDGPWVTDANLGWEEHALSETYAQRDVYDPAICILHYLEQADAQRLGLADADSSRSVPRPPASALDDEAHDDEAGDEESELPEYPSWVSKTVDRAKSWITRDALIESYSNGRVQFDTLEFRLELEPPGDVEWDDLFEQADPQAQYLFKIPVSRRGTAFSAQLTSILANIDRLRMAVGQQ